MRQITRQYLHLYDSLGWSLTELAEQTGLSRRQLSRYRTGDAEPPKILIRFMELAVITGYKNDGKQRKTV